MDIKAVTCCCILVEALGYMQQSSAKAVDLLREAGATGCTDVTGFGLMGHLWGNHHEHKVIGMGADSRLVIHPL